MSRIDKYHLWIKEDFITAFNDRNSWRWSEIIYIRDGYAYRYVKDIDMPLIIWIYSAKEKDSFEKLKKALENYFEITNSVVYIIDEKTFWSIFEKYYEFEKTSY